MVIYETLRGVRRSRGHESERPRSRAPSRAPERVLGRSDATRQTRALWGNCGGLSPSDGQRGRSKTGVKVTMLGLHSVTTCLLMGRWSLLCAVATALATRPLAPRSALGGAGGAQPRVVVAGGTHGNEYTGVYVLQRLHQRAAETAALYPSLGIETLLGNPEAHALNRRFVDDDLNRQFNGERLLDVSCTAMEAERARAIAADLGPKGMAASAAVCIDMHTTTANLGAAIIVPAYSNLAIRAAAFVQTHWQKEWEADTDAALLEDASPEAFVATRLPVPHPLRIILEEGEQFDAGHLASVARDGIEVEVGPTPQGVVRSDVVASTERVLRLLLRFFELHFSGAAMQPALPASVPVYLVKGRVPFVDGGVEGSMLPGAIVASCLQDRDFKPLIKGEPLFEKLDGTIVPYDGCLGDVVWPVFVNEAAYYYHESGRGVRMSQLLEWAVPSAEEN